MDGAKVIVDPHIGQRGHIGGWNGAHVEGEVVKHGPDGRQGEGRVHKGIGWHLRLVQVLWDRSWESFRPLHLLRGLLQWWPNALEGIFSILSFLFLFSFLLDFLN